MQETESTTKNLCIMACMIQLEEKDRRKFSNNNSYTTPIIYELKRQMIRLNISREYIENKRELPEDSISDCDMLVVVYMHFYHPSKNRFPRQLEKISKLC
jgi:hypothetical protein